MDIEQIGNGNDPNFNAFTYVLDPNPSGRNYGVAENLFTFVSFRALPKSRSVIETDGTYNSQFFSSKGIEYITSTFQNTKNYVTTDVYDVGGVEGNDEAFGIKSISIEYNASMTPIVKMEFEDILGAALFNGYEFQDAEGVLHNHSKFATFFSLPYPLFELTVKGFYGKAITYCLHLRKWSAKFDPSVGSFTISAEFIGYTFAFLADVMMKYVMAVTSTARGQELLDQQGSSVISLADLLTSLGKLTSISQDFKESNDSFKELRIINTIANSLSRLYKAIGNVASDKATSIYGNLLPIPQLKANIDQVFIRDILLLLESAKDLHDIIIEDVGKFIIEHNALVDKYVGQYSYLGRFKIQNYPLNIPTSSDSINQSTTQKIVGILQSNDTSAPIGIVTDAAIRSRLNITEDSPNKYFIIDYRNLRVEVSRLNEEIAKKKNEQEEVVNKELNDKLNQDLGFDLSIQSVFNIIIGNVQAYLDYIYEIAVKAENAQLQPFRVGQLNADTSDIRAEDGTIYPFPLSIDANSGEQVWLGDIVGENNQAFPEMQMVRDVMNSLVSINTKIVNDRKSQLEITTITTENPSNDSGGNDWFPINPYDIGSISDYQDIENKPIEELYKIIAKRARIILLNEWSGNRMAYAAILEGSYASTKIPTENKKQQIANIPLKEFITGVFQASSIINEEGDIRLNNESFVVGDLTSIGGFTIAPYDPNPIQKTFPKIVQQSIDLYKESLDDMFISNDKKSLHRKINQKNFITQGDLTDRFWLLEVQDNIRKAYKKATSEDLQPNVAIDGIVIDRLTELTSIDGMINPMIDYSKDNKAQFTNNAKKYIGNTIFGEANIGFSDIFASQYYSIADKNARAFLLLSTFPFQYISDFYSILGLTGDYVFTQMQMFWVSSKFSFTKKLKDFGIDLNNVSIQDISNYIISQNSELNSRYTQNKERIDKYSKKLLSSIVELNYFSDRFILEMNALYESFVDLIFDDIEEEVEAYSVYYSTSEEYEYFEYYKDAYTALLNRLKNKIIFKYFQPTEVLSDFGIKTFYLDSIYIIKGIPTRSQLIKAGNNIEIFARHWRETFSNIVKTPIQPQTPKTTITKTKPPLTDIDDAQEFYLNDKDFKISVYNHFKNMYDKWIGGNINSKIHNFCSYGKGNIKTSPLIDRFHFIDRTWGYIGDKAVINPKPLMVLSELADISLYELIGRICSESKFDFHVLPSWVNYKNIEDVYDMFQPHTTVNDANSGSAFVCMYVGGYSKILDLNKNDSAYINDGFDFRKFDSTQIPNGFKNRRLPINFNDIDDNERNRYNMVAFRVGYADQNQNIFKSVQLDQNEHKETGESLQALSDAFDNRGGTKRFYKSANLYNIFSLRSYKCTVESMGNVMIHPLGYFQLDNVPFFHGAYLITNVSHQISAHNVQTTFSGYRMPRFSYPIVDKATSFVNIPLNETLFSKQEENRSVIRPLNVDEYVALNSNGESDSYGSLDDRSYNISSITDGYGITKSDIERARANNNKLFEISLPNKFHFNYWIQEGMTESMLDQALKTQFNPNSPSNFGITESGNCYGWTKLAMKAMGIIQDAGKGVDAWTFLAGQAENNLFFVPENKYKLGGWTNQDLKNLGIPDGSFVAGFYPSSPYKERAIDVMLNRGISQYKQNMLKKYVALETRGYGKLPPMKDYIMTAEALSKVGDQSKGGHKWMNTSLNNQKMPFIPTTHSMLYINGHLMHSVGKVWIEASPSLRIVAWYPFLDNLRAKLRGQHIAAQSISGGQISYLGSNNVRGVRNNNPLNIVASPNSKWLGKIPYDQNTDKDKRFEQFSSLEYGVRAAILLITGKAYMNGGFNTIRRIVNKWAPKKNGENSGYISTVVKLTSIDANTILSPSNQNTVRSVLKAMSIKEVGYNNGQSWITDDMFDRVWLSLGF